MPNKTFPQGKKHLASDVNLLTDTIKVVLLDLADYTYDETDEFLGDVLAAARVATSPALTGKTLTVVVDAAGDDYVLFDAASTTCLGVTGDSVEGYVTIKDTGDPLTSPLLTYVDRDPAGNPIAVTPNGGNIEVTFDDPNGILRLN